MNVKTDRTKTWTSEINKATSSVPHPDQRCSAGFKTLFVATVAIAALLTEQVVREAIALHRTLAEFQEKAEGIARAPGHFAHSTDRR